MPNGSDQHTSMSLDQEHAAHHAQHDPAAHPVGDQTHAHDRHAGHSVEMFRDRFFFSLLLTLPILYYSELTQRLFGYEALKFPYSEWLPGVLGTIIFFYGGMVFLQSAFHELKARQPGMMTLIAIAITTAYVYSLATTLLLSGTDFFWELTTLITIMLFGHWMEMRSVGQAQGALKELAKLLPDEAERIVGRETETVPVDHLEAGDLILIRPGTTIPADGLIVDGTSEVDESMITGESRPVAKEEDSQVIAGTINGDGSLKVKVTGIGAETALAGIMRLVAQAQASRSRAQILADRAAFYLTIAAISVGALTFAGWLADGDINFALERTVTVLVIACPHALGLAVPLVTAISTALAARSGILVRDRLALENARNIDTIVFDKTGTLTEGKQAVTDIVSVERDRAKEVLRLAASVESESEHHLARSIVEGARNRHVPIAVVKKFTALPGKGVRGTVDGTKIVEVLSPVAVADRAMTVPETMAKSLETAEEQGKTTVFVLVNERIVGAITLADRIRKESREAVRKLRSQGIEVAMITGDAQGVADWVAKELGITTYFAEVLPKDKVTKIKELQHQRRRVGFVGDGVNDAPALTQADVGIAIGAGTDVAIESAGIILMKNDPRDVVKIIELSKATYGKMVQNLAWATGYNVIAIPLAAGAVLWGYEFFLPPALGALFMSASTVIVAANAQLLRRLKL